MYGDFVRKRITELRLRSGDSEHHISAALKRSSGYLYNISSGRSLPSLEQLFAIADYFGLTMTEFFDEKCQYPELISQAVNGMNKLNQDDMNALLGMIGQLCVMRAALDDLAKVDNEDEASAESKRAAKVK
ncbi:MAG: helix-turn-helix domain-containing protein [Oscillospiraceae bacterium]|nr:helix-turn-helix domain-containing protein [Oscillospiraceae bacterium]